MKNTVTISLIVLLCALIACKKHNDSVPITSEPNVNSAPTPEQELEPEEKQPSLVNQVMEKKTLKDAIEFSKLAMEDSYNESSAGSLLLAAWASKNLTWKDVQALPKTRRGLVMKDSDKERGKGLCASGRVIQISKAASDVYAGLILNSALDVYSFLAVKDTGEIEEGSRATFCGVVTQKYSYSNSGGGTTHSIQIVGMFDLPENK